MGFFVTSALLGVGLAMDAFSVSLANGLQEPQMRRGRMSLIAGVFAFFQALMPTLGWLCIHTIAEQFAFFQKLIPYIALILLGYIGGKMLVEGIRCRNSCTATPDGGEVCACCCIQPLAFGALLMQGVATSIDALSVGFTIAEYDWLMALLCTGIIAAVTFVICFAGLAIGKKFDDRLAGRAGILGGAILICIGLEIFLSNILG